MCKDNHKHQKWNSFEKILVFCVISIAPKYRCNPFGMRSTGLLQYSGASLIHGSQVYISSQQMIIIGILVVYLSYFIV